MEHYRSLNSYLKQRFGCKVYKLALDGGFSCPNRDGSIGYGGCIFCSGSGSGDFSRNAAADCDRAIESAKALVSAKNPGGKYIAYFQSFTGTYAPVDYLRRLYSPILQRPDIVALSIGTRPDCLPEDVLALLSELNEIKPVWIELGLQTIHPQTARYIRRGYELPVFDRSLALLKSAGLEVIVHMILGLPGETEDMMFKTAEYIGASGAEGIKLQLLHVLRGTDLAADYERGLFKTLELDEYIRLLEGCLQRLPPQMVVHRLTGDGAKKDLIAPLWSGNKKLVLNSINQALARDSIVQGSLYKK